LHFSFDFPARLVKSCVLEKNYHNLNIKNYENQYD
jgi:hypothetical protein